MLAGNAGVGKTALLSKFLDGAVRANDDEVRIGRGQAVEITAGTDPYGPVLEALERLLRQDTTGRAREILVRYAPSLLSHIPGFSEVPAGQGLEPYAHEISSAQMMRGLALALEEMTREVTVVLALEDLQWSDSATVALLSFLAHRDEPCRLLILATCRPNELVIADHPLRRIERTLHLRGLCSQVAVADLSLPEVRAYLDRRFPNSVFPPDLATLLKACSDGNALFLVKLVDHLISQRWLRPAPDGSWTLAIGLAEIEQAIPEDLNAVVLAELQSLSADEQMVVQCGSVEGVEFDAACVAAGIGRPVEEVETICQSLCDSGRLLRVAGTSEWPDGTTCSHYAFDHALTRKVVYGRIPGAQRVSLHRSVGHRLEQGYAGQTQRVAPQLAVHCQLSRDLERCHRFLMEAAEAAFDKASFEEAVRHAETALGIAKNLDSDPSKARQSALRQKARALCILRGYASPEVGRCLAELRDLCVQLGDDAVTFEATYGLWYHHLWRAEHDDANRIVRSLRSLAAQLPDDRELPVRLAEGATALWHGDLVSAAKALSHLCDVWSTGSVEVPSPLLYAIHPRAAALSNEAYRRWNVGQPDSAVTRANDALAFAEQIARPFTLVAVLTHSALLRILRREFLAADVLAQRGLNVSRQHGITFWRAFVIVLHGRCQLEAGDIDGALSSIDEGMELQRSLGTRMFMSTTLQFRAEALLRAGRAQDAAQAVDEAIEASASSGDRQWESEVWRVKGIVLQDTGCEEASQPQTEKCFRQALELAHRQGARSLELRAAMSLAELLRAQGKPREARALLAPIYAQFSEGLDTLDLQDAKGLLDRLGSS